MFCFSFERAAWVWDVPAGVTGHIQSGVAGQAEQEVHQGDGQVGHDWYHHQEPHWGEWQAYPWSQWHQTQTQYFKSAAVSKIKYSWCVDLSDVILKKRKGC